MFKPGDTPVPGYRLVDFIGRGAYGEVWKTQAPGGAQIALKFIPLQSAAGGVELKSANAVKLIRHANLIPITAIWLLDRNGNVLDDESLERLEKDAKSQSTITVDQLEFKKSLAYLVIAMSLADGSLESRMEHHRELGREGIPVDELLEYMRQAAKGLDFLNEPRHLVNGERVGIVHRDVKPANLLLIGDSVVVGDFGVATSLREFDEKATEMVGSLGFMAPESIARRPTPSTDQYALAITYYFLRTGLMPYSEGQTFDSLILLHKEGRLDFSHVDEREEAVLKKATSVTMEPRYENCSEFVNALVEATREPVDAPPVRKSGLMPLVVVGLAIALLGAAWYFVSGGDSPDNGVPVEPEIKTVQKTITVTPDDATFVVTIQSEDGQARIVGEYQEKATVDLEPADKVHIAAQADSPFAVAINKIFTQADLESTGWHLRMESRTIEDLREQVFQLLEQKKEMEATRLLAKASRFEPSVLDIPSPVTRPHPYAVASLVHGAGSNNFGMLAITDDKKTAVRFANAEGTDKSGEDAWTELSFSGVLQLLQPFESETWTVFLKSSIGSLDSSGAYRELWKSDETSFAFSFAPAAFSKKSDRLAAGDLAGNILVWSTSMDSSLDDPTSFNVHEDSVVALVFNENGDFLISAGMDGSLKRLDLGSSTGTIETISAPSAFSSQVVSGVWMVDDNRVLVSTDEQLWATNFEKGASADSVTLELDGSIGTVCSSSESPWILIGTDSISEPCVLFNMQDSKNGTPSQLAGFGELAMAAFSNGGELIAVSSLKGGMGLIDVTDPDPAFIPISEPTKNYPRLCFSSDDKFLIAVRDDNTEEIWRMDQIRLIMKASTDTARGSSN